MANISDATRDQRLTDTMTNLEKCALRVIEFFPAGPERDAQLAELSQNMETYCMLERRIEASKQSILEARNHDYSDPSSNFKDVFHESYELKLNKITNMKTHPKYLKLLKSIKTLTNIAGEGADEEDLQVTEGEVNTIDPISQRPMTSPVKNKICGHSYEKDSIAQLFQQKRNQFCPYPGCSNRNKFTAADLEDDLVMKQLIKKQQKK